jgi:hypothetical protein
LVPISLPASSFSHFAVSTNLQLPQTSLPTDTHFAAIGNCFRTSQKRGAHAQ